MSFQLTNTFHNRETLEIYQIDNNCQDFHDVNEINKPFHLTCIDHKRKYCYRYVWPKMNRNILLDLEQQLKPLSNASVTDKSQDNQMNTVECWQKTRLTISISKRINIKLDRQSEKCSYSIEQNDI